MMLGWLGDMLQGLIDIVFKPIMDIFNKFLQSLMTLVIGFAVNFVVEMVKCYLNVALYHISIFMLSIIDFIEMCFRAFAGLDNDGASGLRLSIDGKSGDILIQMLTSRAVLDIFFATAIVGVFLLIITTIFSMIKVEYTTEGANNSKSGIIAKSLKSLCNMLIIPLLVIFGVVIGNQVLGLIDTATGGGEGNKISGNLWVTGATNAMFANSKQLIGAVDVGDIGSAVVMVQNKYYTQAFLDLAAPYALQEAFKKTVTDIANIWGASTKFSEVVNSVSFMGALDDGSSHVNPNRSTIESGFKSVEKGYRYYNMQNVTTHYNILEVNYFVIILASTIIIKNLYQCCFGLIDRLYRCTALFIIMPIVVGMTPVKDSLSKWRGDFIGRALAAYGVVISMNLFFTIAAVLLSIDIDFMGAGAGSFFGNLFMKGLIQMVLVVVGCTFIKSLSNDIGSYFGGTDLRATGESVESDAKKTVQDATAGIRKAVDIAGAATVAIATGGISLAGKIKSGMAFKNDMKDAQGSLEEARQGHAQATKDADFADWNIKKEEERRNLATQRMNDAQSVLNDKNASKEDKEKAKATLDSESKAFKAADDRLDAAKKAKADAQDRQDRFGKQMAESSDKITALNSQKKEEQEKARMKRAMVGETIRGTVKKEFDTESVFDKYVTDPTVKDLKKSYKDSYANLDNVSPDFAAFKKSEKAAKDKKEKEDLEARNPVIAERRGKAAGESAQAITEIAKVNEESNNKLIKTLMDMYNNATNDKDKEHIMSRLRAINPDIMTPEGGKFTTESYNNYKVSFDTAGLSEEIKKAQMRGAGSEEFERILKEQLEKWGQTGNVKMIEEMKKAIDNAAQGIK